MELGLVQLALAHLLAAKAGSWVLGHGHTKSNGKSEPQHHDPRHASSNRSRRDRQKRRAPNRPTSDVARLPFASASAGAASAHNSQQVPRPWSASCAWIRFGHSSSTVPVRSWACPRCGKDKAHRLHPRRSEQPPPTESLSQSASEDATSVGLSGSVRWCIPPEQNAQTELLVGWNLDDQSTSDQQQPGLKTMAAAVSAAASRVFGRGGGGGVDADADADAGADAGGPADVGGGTPRQPGASSAPHLVHTPRDLGTDCGGGGGGGCGGVGGGHGGGGNRPAAAATAAAAAAALTSAGGALGGLAERAVDVPVRGLRELNRVVTAGVTDFLASDSGRRLSEQVAAEMSTGALMAPVYLTEELVKARLKSLLRNHACWLATFLAVRVSVATALLHCVKELLRSSVRKARGPRWVRRCVRFLCDVMLPTGFFGPLLGITFGALQLTGVSVGGLLLHRGGGGGGGGGTSDLPAQQPLAAALPAVAAAAGGAVAATVAATVSPVASAAASALAGGAAGGSF